MSPGVPACSTHGSAASTQRKRRAAAGLRSAPKRREKVGKETAPGCPAGHSTPPRALRAGLAPTPPRAPHLPSPPAALPSPAPSAATWPLRNGKGRSDTGEGGPSSLPLLCARPPVVGEGGEERCPSRSVLRVCCCSLCRDTSSAVTPGHRTASGVAFRGLRLPGENEF